MFFKLHDEHRIGYKKLTPADLGIGTSHQTHIGLYEDVLNYLPNTGIVKTAMLIYKDYCDIIDCFFDRIENPDGTFRSPKIRIGDTDSVARRIRHFAHSNNYAAEWYLVWFGLYSQELVFLLLDSSSADYEALHPYFDSGKHIIQGKSYTDYQVYRLYDMSKSTKALRICTSFLAYAERVYASQMLFSKELITVSTKAQTINYAVAPTIFSCKKEIKF